MRQRHFGTAGSGGHGFGWLKSLTLLPVPLFIALIIYFAYTGQATVNEPPYLLLVLNTLFTTIIPFTIAYLAWRSYSNSGQWSLFLIGCSMVAFGYGSMEAGFVINIPGGVNLAVAVYNTCALLAAVLIITAAIFSVIKSTRYRLERNRALYLGLCYVAVFVLMSLFTMAVYQGLVPAFFVQGAGPTLLRQLVLGTAVLLFAVSCVIFLVLYFRSRSDFTYWFSIALLLITVGLCTVLLQKNVGGPSGWTGRAAQYLGCVYLLVGVVAAYRISGIKKVPLENEFARSFNYIDTNYRTLVEIASDAIMSVDNKGTILTWNPAAANIFGYSVSEATGVNVMDFIFPRESALLINNELQKLAGTSNRVADAGNKLETVARRKRGEEFPAEVSMSLKKVEGEWLGIFIIRDITERRQVEKALRESEERFRRISQISTDIAYSCVTSPDGVYHIDWLAGAAEQTTGYTADEIMAQSCWRFLVIEEDRPLFEKNVIGLSPDQAASCDLRICSKSGQIIWVSSFAECVRDNINSKLLRLHGGLNNVTERKHAEEKTLRHSTVRHAINRVFEEALRCDTVAEVASICLSVAQELSGSKFGWVGELNSSGHLDTIALSDPGWESCRMPQSQAVKMIKDMQVRGIWGRVLKDGKSLIANIPASHPDSVGLPQGHPELTAFMGVPLKHAGQTIGMIALANKPGGYDIHDQEAIESIAVAFEEALRSKRADEAILRSKLLLQSVIDSTPDWMYVKDLQHRFLLVNKSFAEGQNIAPQDMVGRPDTDFFPEELCLGNPEKGIRGFHADDNQAFRGNTVHNPGNLITWADGSLHIYDSYKIPLADQSGKVYAALVYSRDITGQRKAEDEREASFKTLHKTLHDIINTMSKIVEMRDPYTSGHQGRVAVLAGAIAREMKLDDSRVEHLMMAASIHDVGKMYVPADILSKPGKLSDIEWAIIKTHVEGSYEILKDLEFSQPIAIMARQHHERMDGSGYPNGLKGEDMLLEAKILAVADVVEAMSSHRPYRPALGTDKALEEISVNKGKLYDTGVVDICLMLFKERGFKFEG